MKTPTNTDRYPTLTAESMIKQLKGDEVARINDLDEFVTLADQKQSEEGPVAVINLFIVEVKNEETLLKVRSHDAGYIKSQLGYISVQLH